MRTLLVLLAAAALAASCKKAQPIQGASVKDGPSGGANNARVFWLRSPEALVSTVTRTYGIAMSEDETRRYISNVHSLLGGTSVTQRRATLTQPNDLFVLTLDNFAVWLAAKIVDKQKSLEAGAPGTPAPFTGYPGSVRIRDAAQCTACYESADKAWCDCGDGVSTDYLKTKGLKAEQIAGNKEVMKRLMHNVQDIGEFLRCRTGFIDDKTDVGSGDEKKNAARYLVEDIFIPALGTAEPNEELAWARVTHAILMGQGCFLKF